MSANLFGEPGAEELHYEPHAVWESREDYWPERWAEDPTIVFEIEEWTSRPIRHFIKAANVIDRIAEYDCEEFLDEWGRTSEILEAAGKDPAVVAAFDAALDLLFAKVSYVWANERAATHKVTFNPADPGNPLYDGEPLYRKAAT